MITLFDWILYITLQNRYACDNTPSIGVEIFNDSSCTVSGGSSSYESCYPLGTTLYDAGSTIYNVSVYASPVTCYGGSSGPTSTTITVPTAAGTTATGTATSMTTPDTTAIATGSATGGSSSPDDSTTDTSMSSTEEESESPDDGTTTTEETPSGNGSSIKTVSFVSFLVAFVPVMVG